MADSSTDLKASFTAISNGISWLHREHDGRGADRIRTLIPYDMVLTMLGDCLTTASTSGQSRNLGTSLDFNRATRPFRQEVRRELAVTGRGGVTL